MTTTDDLVPDTLWQAIQPLLPTPPRRYGGPDPLDDRAALGGIVYQLRTRVPWRLLPTHELGCGSPVTCWRRRATGSAPGCGSDSTTCSLMSSAATARSTGPGR